ncbi:MAG: erythronate-4-phosphate dehydrogenase [Gammaproteobacteria bacterium]|nr:erythronate-4-phosphate dehydrogenase [Gammaproteobacteria bacterium]
MQIVADANIPGLDALCGSFGTIQVVDGRSIHRAHLAHAEVLLVRSVTPVNAGLLAGTPVKFVGSATAGIDHIDTEYLAACGIHFAYAPGCNAVAVAEYVLACGLAYCAAVGRNLNELAVGVIGYGHVGQAVVHLLTALKVRCLLNDPPRAEVDPAIRYHTLPEVLDADIVTVHVPLNDTGPYPTRGLIDRHALSTMRPTALLINAARGGVLDERAWLSLMSAGQPRYLAVDCWQGEPRIDHATLAQAWVASPHIAGHTVDARWRATRMLADDLARFVHQPTPDSEPGPATPIDHSIMLGEESGLLNKLTTVIQKICPLQTWTQALHGIAGRPLNEAPRYFDQLRREFGVRREFSTYSVSSATLASAEIQSLKALGFNFEPC